MTAARNAAVIYLQTKKRSNEKGKNAGKKDHNSFTDDRGKRKSHRI
jgi:hypothetical protein